MYKNGALVKYVRIEDADVAQGDCVYYASTDGWEVTNVVSGGSRIGDVPAGIAMAAISDGNYGYVQISGKGQVDVSLTSGDFTAGDAMYGNTSADGKVATATIGTHHVIGVALTASTASVLSAGNYVLLGMH
jgi:hypothetical protein